MYNNAIEEGLADINPFAGLGMTQGDGRKDIIVLTSEEVDKLAEHAVQVHGQKFGVEFAAMILWGAYTCMRPGETFAARYSRLKDDTYSVKKQFNSRLGKETKPKHNSTGTIYVPDPAREAVLSKPRRLSDDLMFRTKRNKQFRQTSLHEAWKTVRAAFTATLPATHHLRERFAADPRRPARLLRAAPLRRLLHAQRARARTLDHRRAATPQRRRRARDPALRAPRPHTSNRPHSPRIRGKRPPTPPPYR
jgi:hypothetical protein